MENETTKRTPILEIAWTRYAQFNEAASHRTRGYFQIRKWTLWLGVITVLFAILNQIFQTSLPSLLGQVINIMFIAAPILASIFIAFTSRFNQLDSWLVMRAGAEEIHKEIYLYRTVYQGTPHRNEYLKKRLSEIQRQISNSLSGEFSFEPYHGPIPPYYYPADPNSDPGFQDLTGDEYFRYRLEVQFNWHNRKINVYKSARQRLFLIILGTGGLGSLIAYTGGEFSIFAALAGSLTLALIGWQELNNHDSLIRDYSRVVTELTFIYDHWSNLEPEQRTTSEYQKMVLGCETLLWAQHIKFIRSTQDVLRESDLEEEAGLVEDILAKAVESTNSARQRLYESVQYEDGEYNERN